MCCSRCRWIRLGFLQNNGDCLGGDAAVLLCKECSKEDVQQIEEKIRTMIGCQQFAFSYVSRQSSYNIRNTGSM